MEQKVVPKKKKRKRKTKGKRLLRRLKPKEPLRSQSEYICSENFNDFCQMVTEMGNGKQLEQLMVKLHLNYCIKNLLETKRRPHKYR
jgi:hypothetical protein